MGIAGIGFSKLFSYGWIKDTWSMIFFLVMHEKCHAPFVIYVSSLYTLTTLSISIDLIVNA